ncbi:CaiB/BaiF CoA transferase family protein [Prauserella muralis]|uniref:Formyl-CoA transferase n=1 Tax=Prauserella muralis TaxID=588067 RepID=A0A2V4ATS3_9PSEU|nr:CoA transferase [Prauserella muralis]PXY18947.1 formyl-CoA transferase [Prauserella muralis]TWE28829.1 succinyl-CoA:(R)-citramalate CoA-transferase [Prauserella muralis]
MTAGALDGLRVLEMGQLLAGPFCGQLLGDHGADVVKLEDPRAGDPIRQWGREQKDGTPLWWPIVARNKKSVTCDLRTADGQRIAREFAAQADIVLENFKPGTLERWGLGYDELSAANPGLIMVRVSGFGQTGPDAHRPGYGSIGEAVGGLRDVVGDPDRPPSRCGISIGDSLAGTFACVGTLAALHHRTATGRGQIVDVAIYESVLAVMESLLPEWELAGHRRPRTGARLPNVVPSNVYPTADGGGVLIAANADSPFRRLFTLMGEPELGERYAPHEERIARADELDALIAAWSARHTTEEVLSLLDTHDVPAGRIYTAADMLADPHFAARESIVHVTEPRLGSFPMQNIFPRLSDTPGAIRWTGPTLGEHTDELLSKDLGRSPAEIDDLRKRGVV